MKQAEHLNACYAEKLLLNKSHVAVMKGFSMMDHILMAFALAAVSILKFRVETTKEWIATTSPKQAKSCPSVMRKNVVCTCFDY